MEKLKFSISRVNTYLENPWKHWCKYQAKYKPKYDPEANKYMDRGTVFHKVMECMGKGTPLEKAKLIALQEAEEKGFAEEAKQSGIVAVDRYLEEHKNDPDFNIIETEYHLDYPISDTAEFTGFIDAIIMNVDGTITLIDYKTYSNAPQENKLKYSLQANMYMAVATKLGFKVKGFIFDCVNPKLVLKGRAYKTKRIQFRYNSIVAENMYNQFCEVVKMIEQFPEFNMYVPGDYLPDMYDMLYKVWVGDIMEDLDTFLETHFEMENDLEND